MEQIFLKILNMSISASYIVLAVLVLRLLLKQAPKWIRTVLWGIVAVRLVCPFSFESIISLIPSAETVSPDIMLDQTPEIHTGISVVDQVVNPAIGQTFTPTPGVSANPLQVWIPILALVWIAGIAALLFYTVISYVRIKRKIGTAVLLCDNVYQSETVVSPFVLGLFKPKIYLSFRMSSQDMAHVIAHERAHIRRKDHIWKPFGFLLLILHWFNPLLWLGYALFCRDIELACDEKVIRELDRDKRADYSQALLTCSVKGQRIAACPLAFGEVGVKERIRSVLRYKKPAFWLSLIAVLLCIAAALCFLTSPMEVDMPPYMDVFTDFVGVYVTIESVHTDENGQNIFYVVWHNATGNEVVVDDSFTVVQWIDREWKPIDLEAGGLYPPGEYHLKPRETRSATYFVGRYDFTKSGRYRFIVPYTIKKEGNHLLGKASTDLVIGGTQDIRTLYQKYPEYFGLDASAGLDVYVWQMGPNSYSFGLLPHSEVPRYRFSPELGDLKETGVEEMRVILSTYDIDSSQIHVLPWDNWLSSYRGWYSIIDEDDPYEKAEIYVEFLRQKLFGEVVFTTSQSD
ncbi:MAG: hypothetical protein J6B71_06585 [Clostridia bacterium]|nr:hypothetical protein [Clostridia bacterium]